MLTYQLQRRGFWVEKDDKKLSFPNDVELEICLEPSELFGVGDKPCRVTLPGYDVEMLVDQYTGKSSVVSNHLFGPIEAFVEWGNLRFEMRGNKLYAKRKIEKIDELIGLLQSLHYFLPMLLNIEFIEPPTVKYIHGRVGDTPFRWELLTSKQTFEVTNKERQEHLVIDSINRLNFIRNSDNLRLAAALSYYYTAKRLMYAGNSPFEFMAEMVLNYCKVLEILFAHSDKTMDDVRGALPTFGYTEDDIEVKFIPIMILRNEIDVGHVTIETFKENQLAVLHEYLTLTEPDFRELLKRIINKAQDGNYSPKRASDLKKNKNKQRIMNNLINTCGKRIRSKTTQVT